MNRYMDIKGRRCCISSHSLDELRGQEKQIQLHFNAGLSHSPGAITVSELEGSILSLKIERFTEITRKKEA